jgi:ABC-type multidrug transport system ATPase subunit
VTTLRDEGGSVVFSTQNLEELDLYARRVAVLQRGRLTFLGSAAEYGELHAEEVFS